MSDVTEHLGLWREDSRAAGTESWVHVLSVDLGTGYEWDELAAFYSPAGRRFYWISGSGCSCNSLGDEVTGIASFEEGDRDALRRAIKRFADASYYPAAEVAPKRLAAIQSVKAFTP